MDSSKWLTTGLWTHVASSFFLSLPWLIVKCWCWLLVSRYLCCCVPSSHELWQWGRYSFLVGWTQKVHNAIQFSDRFLGPRGPVIRDPISNGLRRACLFARDCTQWFQIQVLYSIRCRRPIPLNQKYRVYCVDLIFSRNRKYRVYGVDLIFSRDRWNRE